MAKVKITGHASGSGVITVTAPNTSTDRTITLPDATATIATTADVTAATFNPDAAQVFNESGADVDFRVESDTKTHALFVDGATGAVGLGTTAGNYNSTADNLVVYDADQHAGITIASGGTNKVGAIYFADGTSGTAEYEGYIEYNHNTNGMIFGTNHASRLDLTSDGKGRSMFTAAAWFSAEGAGTPSFHQSHNCSSIASMGSDGYYQVNWDTDFANGNYAIVNNAHRDSYEDQSIYNLAYSTGNVRYVYVQDSTGAQDISDFSSLAFGA
tara:strand:- start:487 stop:1299 length:813 start_codon:yes stop_codon:yes gene_type:complete